MSFERMKKKQIHQEKKKCEVDKWVTTEANIICYSTLITTKATTPFRPVDNCLF